MQSHIRKVYACLTVTCRLHFWQNDRDLLCATAVTQGWNRYQNKSQNRKLTMEKKIILPLCRDSNPGPFNHEFGALTTELSLPSMSAKNTQDCSFSRYSNAELSLGRHWQGLRSQEVVVGGGGGGGGGGNGGTVHSHHQNDTLH